MVHRVSTNIRSKSLWSSLSGSQRALLPYGQPWCGAQVWFCEHIPPGSKPWWHQWRKTSFLAAYWREEKHKVAVRISFTIIDKVHSFTSEFIPCKVEALVSEKTQCELQAREEEKVAEINQAQHLKPLHSWKTFSPAISGPKINCANRSNRCALLQTHFLL